MTRNGTTKIRLLVLLVAVSLPASVWAQPTCSALEDTEPVAENEMILAAERGGVAILDFSAKYAEMTISIRGVLCDPTGTPIADAPIRLVRYGINPEAAGKPLAERPTVEDLQYANGRPYFLVGVREAQSARNGEFRFIGVSAGKVALEVDWERLSSLPFVTWSLSWSPGPIMAVSRDVP